MSRRRRVVASDPSRRKLEALDVAVRTTADVATCLWSVRVLEALYELADARGFELLHAFVVPRVAESSDSRESTGWLRRPSSRC